MDLQSRGRRGFYFALLTSTVKKEARGRGCQRASQEELGEVRVGQVNAVPRYPVLLAAIAAAFDVKTGFFQ